MHLCLVPCSATQFENKSAPNKFTPSIHIHVHIHVHIHLICTRVAYSPLGEHLAAVDAAGGLRLWAPSSEPSSLHPYFHIQVRRLPHPLHHHYCLCWWCHGSLQGH